jgi:hypothetical protein
MEEASMPTEMEMGRYIGTKQVYAVPMDRFAAEDYLGRNIKPRDEYENEDGYLVEYEDRYKSWSPKGAFEKAYRPADGLTFGIALEAVKQGKGMRLPQWKEDVVIRAQYPDEHSKMTAPYLYVESRFGKVPWKETMIELFSDAWVVVDIPTV